MSLNIQNLAALRASGIKRGDLLHLGVCGNHVTDAAVYLCEWNEGYDAAIIDANKALGLKEDASDNDVRRAFRKLALKLHPDGSEPDPEKFMVVRTAYEKLCDTRPQIVNLGVKIMLEGQQIDLYWGDIIQMWKVPGEPRALLSVYA